MTPQPLLLPGPRLNVDLLGRADHDYIDPMGVRWLVWVFGHGAGLTIAYEPGHIQAMATHYGEVTMSYSCHPSELA